MKILFLDIDGVLNTAPFLEKLLENTPTGCHLVISSTWRLMFFRPGEINTILAEQGFQWSHRIIGGTEALADRNEEILEWLSRHPVDRFAVLDDMDLTVPNFVQTSVQTGLGETHVEEVVRLLGPVDKEAEIL